MYSGIHHNNFQTYLNLVIEEEISDESQLN